MSSLLQLICAHPAASTLLATNAATLYLLVRHWRGRTMISAAQKKQEEKKTGEEEEEEKQNDQTDEVNQDENTEDEDNTAQQAAATYKNKTNPTNDTTGADDGLVENSSPTRQTFRSSHTLPQDDATTNKSTSSQQEGKENSSKRFQRTVYCLDTNEYLRGVEPAPRANLKSSSAAGAIAASAAAASTATPAPSSSSDSSSSSSSSTTTTTTSTTSTWSSCSIITSVPDISETGLSLPRWRRWFLSVCKRILERVRDDNVAIFYQTDIRLEEQWISKAYLVMKAAEECNMNLIWHKIVLINNLQTIRGSTASYVHLLCFALPGPFHHHQEVKGGGGGGHIENSATLTPDIIGSRGAMLWKRAMGLSACEYACRYISLHVPSTHTIIDPFCGSGSILCMANRFGFHSIGIDHCRKRCVQASQLKLELMLNPSKCEETEKKMMHIRRHDPLGRGATTAASSSSSSTLMTNKKEQAQKRKRERKESGRTQREQQLWEKEQRGYSKQQQQQQEEQKL